MARIRQGCFKISFLKKFVQGYRKKLWNRCLGKKGFLLIIDVPQNLVWGWSTRKPGDGASEVEKSLVPTWCNGAPGFGMEHPRSKRVVH